MTDLELLTEYASHQSEDAFRVLVHRHIGLVRGTALRRLGQVHQAEEASHAVFIALARKANSLTESTVVAGWLFRATQFAAAKLARDEERRTRREREAAMNQITLSSEQDDEHVWNEITPHLDDALLSLTEKDREALLLRFFENRSFAEVGSTLGAGEDAAKMRVGRALRKLREFFRKRGLMIGSAALAGAFSTKASAAVSENVANSLASKLAEGGTTPPTTATLVDSILKRFWLIRMRQWVTWIGSVLLVAILVGMMGYKLDWFGQPAAMPAWPAMPAPPKP